MAPAFLLPTIIMRKIQKELPIEVFGFSEECLIRKSGDYGIYFRPLNNDVSLDTPIFRYILIDYLMPMISHSSLYIPNRCKFTDLREKDGQEKFIPTKRLRFPIQEVPSYKNRTAFKEKEQTKKDVLTLCVSCWTKDAAGNEVPTENYLMWQAYRKSDLMCRIGTTVHKLIDNIQPTCNILISEVSYGERQGPTSDCMTFGKAKYYSGEKEIRMVPLVLSMDHMDIRIKDICKFIDSITLSPFLTPNIEYAMLSHLKKQYPKLSDKILPSMIREYPKI